MTRVAHMMGDGSIMTGPAMGHEMPNGQTMTGPMHTMDDGSTMTGPAMSSGQTSTTHGGGMMGSGAHDGMMGGNG